MLKANTFENCCSVLTAVFLFLSCSGAENPSDVTITYDTLSIAIDENSLNSYPVKVVSGNKLIGYNHTLHTIDKIDIQAEQVITNIRLEADGPNKIDVAGLLAINDQMGCIGNNHFILIDKHGKITCKIVLNDIIPSQFDHTTPFSIGNNIKDISIDNENNLVIPLFHSGQYSFYGLLRYSWADSSAQVISLEDIPFVNKKFGLLEKPFIRSIGTDSVMLSTFHSNEIHLLSISDGTITNTIEPKSSVKSGSAPEVRSQDLNSMYDHYVKNRRYFNPVFLGNANYLARVINKKDPKKSFDRSSQYLCIFDMQGNELMARKMHEKIRPQIFKMDDQTLVFEMESGQEEILELLKVTVK